MEFNLLPEDCVSHILSLTSPRDACRYCLVSTALRSAAQSNVVWENFLPSDFQEILWMSVSPVSFLSKKELYFSLCSPILVDGGRKVFSLDKFTGKKCYMLCARELSITWGSDPMYWTWKPLSESRFAEVAELRSIWWLEIHGKINSRMLSPKTTYAAYLVVKFADRAYGLDSLPSELSVEVGSHQSRAKAYLRCHDNRKESLERLYYSNRIQVLGARVEQGEERLPCERSDGWMEVELGDFFTDGCDGEVKMSLTEVKGYHLKGGLIVEGIEVRPKV
ncbi:PREDICTED: F-box protein PP2-B15-like [Nelumbo nucifera]|uniref:F-box protein PP2-B15-like n=2 Tax=Nelumbo nucifera TaxID=4432 RepID=A0A1U8B209_NELNU|nr:PREDICTED: F-box protein PP2-B15-like [Nelumbo nucifera]DAD33235.1 TPA_asm: hypothetical protein HUJ06_012086 [Nelumbo nucifera]